MAQVVEHLPSKGKELSSNPWTGRKNGLRSRIYRELPTFNNEKFNSIIKDIKIQFTKHDMQKVSKNMERC
jgi:hypothetical protein